MTEKVKRWAIFGGGILLVISAAVLYHLFVLAIWWVDLLAYTGLFGIGVAVVWKSEGGNNV